jgi:2-keto-4-pentenoate hydratase
MDDPRIARGMKTQLALRRARLAAGDKALGWKVGFGAPAAMERLAIAAPLVGFLTGHAIVASGSTLSLAKWNKPVAEPEIAVYLGRDLPGGADRVTAQAAIAGLGPAIELADVDRPPDDVESILAGNIYQRNVVLGRCETARAAGRLDGMVARVMRNGNEIARTADIQALTGELVDIVRHVAEVLAACGEQLQAGQAIIAGSIVPPLWVEAGDEVEFALDPVDAVSIRFASKDTPA